MKKQKWRKTETFSRLKLFRYWYLEWFNKKKIWPTFFHFTYHQPQCFGNPLVMEIGVVQNHLELVIACLDNTIYVKSKKNQSSAFFFVTIHYNFFFLFNNYQAKNCTSSAQQSVPFLLIGINCQAKVAQNTKASTFQKLLRSRF